MDTYEDGYKPADDWLITPKFTVKAGELFSFWLRGNASYPDDVEVYFSKSGTAAADFTGTIGVVKTPGQWGKFNFSLDKVTGLVAGDQIHIGFRVKTEGSRVFLDEVRVGPYEFPKFLRIYTAGDKEISAVMDGDVLVDYLNVANFELQGTSKVTFAKATIDAQNPAIIHFTEASANIVADLTEDKFVNTKNSNEIPLYAGIIPLNFTSITNAGGSLKPGITATFKAVVMHISSDEVRAWVQDKAEAHHGVNVYGADFVLSVKEKIGQEILFFGNFDPYKNQSEITPATFVKVLNENPTALMPVDIKGTDISNAIAADTDPAEMYEGLLVRIRTAKIESFDGTYFVATDDNTKRFNVGDRLKIFTGTFTETSLTANKIYDITGIVSGRDGEWAITPSNANDIALAKFDVTFVVKHGTNPLADADVTFGGSTKKTDATGTVKFEQITYGNLPYKVAKTNYITVENTVDFNSNKTVNVTVIAVGLSNQFANEFSVYPNPISEQAFISIELSANTKADVRVLDMRGREIMHEIHSNTLQGTNLLPLNVTELRAGQYILQVNAGTENYRRIITVR